MHLKWKNRLRSYELRDEKFSVVTIDIWAKVAKASIEMTKEITNQIEPIETRGRVKKASRSRDLLSVLENRVVNLEESFARGKYLRWVRDAPN